MLEDVLLLSGIDPPAQGQGPKIVLLQGSTVPGHAARALWNLTSKNAANQDAAKEAGAVPLLVAMLATAPKEVSEWLMSMRALSPSSNCVQTQPHAMCHRAAAYVTYSNSAAALLCDCSRQGPRAYIWSKLSFCA